MSDTFNKKLFEFDYSNMSGGTFSLGDFSKYQNVTLSLEWTGLNSADSVISFAQRTETSTSWNYPNGLNYTLSVGAGSQELLQAVFNDKNVGVKVDAGTATAGILQIFVKGNSF